MPVRRSTVYALDLIASTARRPRSTCTSARGRTSARSRRRSAATAARCGARRSGRSRSRRPTGSGSCPSTRPWRAWRAGRVTVARTPDELEPGRVRSRSARSTASTAGIGRCCRRRSTPPGTSGARADGGHLRPAPARGVRLRRRAALDARAAARAARRRPGSRTCSCVEFTDETAATEPEAFAESVLRAIGAEVVLAGAGFRFGHRRARRPRAAERLGFDARAVPLVGGRLVDDDPAARPRGRDRRGRARCSGGPSRSTAIVVSGDARGGTLGFPTANLRVSRTCSCRGTGSTPARRSGVARCGLDRDESALRRRRAADRGVPARLRGRPLRAAARRRAVATAARRACLRERAGADRADRERRGADARCRPPRHGLTGWAQEICPLRNLLLCGTGSGARASPDRPDAGALPRLRHRLHEAHGRRNRRAESRLPPLRLHRLDSGQRRRHPCAGTAARPLRRGSAAAPRRPTALTPPK